MIVDMQIESLAAPNPSRDDDVARLRVPPHSVEAEQSVLGGLLIGLIESFWAAYLWAEYKDVATFGILCLVLMLRPSGLLGRPEVEKV